MSKFAPITSNLLARKGGAVPSMMMSQRPPLLVAPPPPPPPSVEHRHGIDLRGAHDGDFPPPHDPLRPKRLFIALSHREHERIAIAAVKTGLSRHELVRDALESYLDQLARDMGAECHCISGACGACKS